MRTREAPFCKTVIITMHAVMQCIYGSSPIKQFNLICLDNKLIHEPQSIFNENDDKIRIMAGLLQLR